MNELFEGKEKEHKTSLNFLESCLFGTILEDTITEMRILAECNNPLRVTKAISDMPILLTHKYQVTQHDDKDELEGIETKNLKCNAYKLNKFENDRISLAKVIAKTYFYLVSKKSFTVLKDEIDKILNRDLYLEYLLQEETKGKQLKRELYKQLRQQRNHIKTIIYESNNSIDMLKSTVGDVSVYAEIEIRYISNWQKSRIEQLDQSIYDTESGSSGIIEYYKQRLDQEQRVHSEIELLNNISIHETLEKVEDWMNKYDAEMDGIDLKIQFKKNDYQNMLERRIDLENTLEKHDDLIKEWIKFKDDREKLQLYKENMTKSAIIVQAWWRGLLVRRRLGPFKEPKKKGSKKK